MNPWLYRRLKDVLPSNLLPRAAQGAPDSPAAKDIMHMASEYTTLMGRARAKRPEKWLVHVTLGLHLLALVLVPGVGPLVPDAVVRMALSYERPFSRHG